MHGTSSSTSHGASCRSVSETGPTGRDQRVLGRRPRAPGSPLPRRRFPAGRSAFVVFVRLPAPARRERRVVFRRPGFDLESNRIAHIRVPARNAAARAEDDLPPSATPQSRSGSDAASVRSPRMPWAKRRPLILLMWPVRSRMDVGVRDAGGVRPPLRPTARGQQRRRDVRRDRWR